MEIVPAKSKPIRRAIVALLSLMLRVFYRHIEVAGRERVPEQGSILYVLNHPNALVDPVFILCLTTRPVSFLAKSTLFRMPVISYFVRALDSIPVYRKQDAGEDTGRNRETFQKCRELLQQGGAIAICPEGVSHDEPRLRPLKSGAARIALGAASAGGRNIDLRVVPCGLYYTSKTTFRSAALLYFGEPLKIEPVALEEDGEPPREAVAAVSQQIERALREVVLNAEHEEALNTIARAERIFSAEAQEETDSQPNLKREFELRRRFIEGYASLRARAPERLSALTSRITRYEEELDQVGIDPRDLTVPDSPRAAVSRAIRRTVPSLLLLPFAVVGTAIHYPAYKLAGFFAHKFSGSYDDVISTIKILAATLLFPLTWAGAGLLCYLFLHDWKYVLAALLLVPLAGYAAVRFYEELDRFIAGARALLFFITRRWFFKKLLVERRAIHEEILSLGNQAVSEVGN
ncbi:MAG: 1-acyl-sn-glycerol-3-phosphate acyltransferase [Acidobacteria bacterium]|nr:1-acyl-sn-glycerol-3-phosphate acyltransferase [Acidobacteriota bacterium]